MPLIEDRAIYPTMIRLAGCLCLEMEAEGGPALCYCGVIAGELVLDFCGGDCGANGCGGQAWVRLSSAFPSSSFPNPADLTNNCFAPLAYSLEVGVARCAPMGDAGGPNGYTPPTLDQQVEALRLQTADIAAMRRAIQCCFGEADTDYILGQYDQSFVNGGGCLGGVFTVTVWEEF
jgi:hypothetical protein